MPNFRSIAATVILLLLGAAVCDCVHAGIVLGLGTDSEFSSHQPRMETPIEERESTPSVRDALDLVVVSLDMDGGAGPMPAIQLSYMFVLETFEELFMLPDVVPTQVGLQPPDHIPVT